MRNVMWMPCRQRFWPGVDLAHSNCGTRAARRLSGAPGKQEQHQMELLLPVGETNWDKPNVTPVITTPSQ
jgi:hypothetical protein